jgi:hypothetical protein
LAPITMAPRSASASPFCRPEEDPFLLLGACGEAIESILLGHAGRPLRRSWMDRPYGKEELARLEEEVLPAIQPDRGVLQLVCSATGSGGAVGPTKPAGGSVFDVA